MRLYDSNYIPLQIWALKYKGLGLVPPATDLEGECSFLAWPSKGEASKALNAMSKAGEFGKGEVEIVQLMGPAPKSKRTKDDIEITEHSLLGMPIR